MSLLTLDLNCLEARVGVLVLITAVDAQELDLLLATETKHNFGVHLTLERRDLHVEFLHQKRKNILHLAVNADVGDWLQVGLLEVYDDQLTTRHGGDDWHRGDWEDSQGAARANHKIRLTGLVKPISQGLGRQTLTKVDDVVPKAAGTLWVVADIACSMALARSIWVLDELLSQVLVLALLTDLNAHVAVNLSELFGRDAALSVQAVDVLTNDMLQLASVA